MISILHLFSKVRKCITNESIKVTLQGLLITLKEIVFRLLLFHYNTVHLQSTQGFERSLYRIVLNKK